MRVRDRVEQSLVVVGHLPEGIPRFWLLDNNALETFVEDELQYGVHAAVEAKILTDVNGTSGIQTQAYATTVLATPRNGLTKAGDRWLRSWLAGAIPSGLEDVELARASSKRRRALELAQPPAVHSWTNDPTRPCVCARWPSRRA